MSDHIKRAERIVARINELAAVSEEEGCITRTYGTKAFIEGSRKVFEWMNEAGLQTWVDNIGNVRGRLSADDRKAKTFVIASHIDTVVNAGKFDGPLGVIMGLDILEQVIATKTKLPFNLELIAFSDEEGCRFHTTYLGSKVVAGSFDINLLKKKDSAGISLQEASEAMGADSSRIELDAIGSNNWQGYFEIHIEQGPVLYEKNIPVAVVTAIAGQRRAEISFKGMAGHAGTVPMDMRHDALCAAAEFVLAVEEFAFDKKDKIVATVGKLNINHAASNVIPGKVTCSLDLRSPDEISLSAAYESLLEISENIAVNRNIEIDWHLVQQSKPVACDERMNALLANAIQHSGYELIELVSGAGHDGVPISVVSPVAMLFVRCFKGISHNPLEDTELKDIVAAIKVSDNFMQQILSVV